MHPHGGHHSGGGGHFPQFWGGGNWGGWPDYSPTVYVEQPSLPTWALVAGGALAGLLLALLTRK